MQKGFSQLNLLEIFLAATLLCVIGIVIISQKQTSSLAAQIQQSTQSGKPTENVVDLAPKLAANEKTVLVIQNSDSSMQKIILPTDAVAGYISALPKGEKIISQTPFSR